jgi:acetoin utilization protein AcuC
MAEVKDPMPSGNGREPAETTAGQPIVVFGDGSLAYDFGTGHPLTPRRFGPGIDMLRSVGAGRFQAPSPAGDDALRRVHDPAYIEAVRRASRDPVPAPASGLVPWGDNPPFAGMHEAAATVAGGSIAAVAAILDGTARRAFHPGGGLHHAMPDRASGFCIYNDVALAIALARDAGHRVMYVDLDVHHGDGVQAIFWDDARVLTVSVHETGLALFPGSGHVAERGGPTALGSAVNVPLEPGTGDASWLSAVRSVVPPLAGAWQPTFLVSQHGCDTHLYDPLAHLRLTTAAMGAAARLLDAVADEHAEGRWFATGGGGYDIHRVVPRAWSLTWLAQARRPVPPAVPDEWLERWGPSAAEAHHLPLPDRFEDDPAVAPAEPAGVAAANARVARDAVSVALRLLG